MKTKKTLLFILKAVISVSLLLFITFKIDWDTASKNLQNANYLFLFAAYSLNLLERAELTYKWNLLIKARGIHVSFIRLFIINAIGTFWGLFIPSSLGTDVVRGYYLVKNNSEKNVSVSSVFVDRIMGLFSLLLLAVMSIFFTGNTLGSNITVYVIVLFIFAVATLYLFQREDILNLFQRILEKTKFRKFGKTISELHESVLEYKKHPKTLLSSFLYTMLVQVTRVLTFYFVALAFNISVPVVYYFLFIPVVMLILMIPISIGGLGVREGTFVALFTLAGMSVSHGIIISFTNSLFDTLNTVLLGGIFYLFYDSSAKHKISANASLEGVQLNEK